MFIYPGSAADRISGLCGHFGSERRPAERRRGAGRVVQRILQHTRALAAFAAGQRTAVVSLLPARGCQGAGGLVRAIDWIAVCAKAVDRAVAAACVAEPLSQTRRIRMIWKQ